VGITDVCVAIEDVSLTRGGRRVLTDVCADVSRARVTALVGPSGAGKTSLLRCVNRLEAPDRGRVLLDDVDVASLEPASLRKRVGMIFQIPVLFEGGVRANLSYGLEKVSDDALVEALEIVGLSGDFIERSSAALSVGQAQRVCMARALVRQPEVLLMDEPTASLDRNAAGRIEDLIGEIVDRGVTVAIVTHDLAQARRVARRAVLLVDGRVAGTGQPEQLEDLWPRAEQP
jgi:putative ABC transport system ATP-binding protein